MSQNSAESSGFDPPDLLWREAELAQLRRFMALPLAEKWRAAAEAGELILLIEAGRRAAAKSENPQASS